MDRSESGKQSYERTKHIQAEINAEKSRKVRAAYEENPKHCLFCNEKISFEKRRGKFCNQSCAASFNNRGIIRNPKSSTLCACGNTKSSRNKYCSECIEKRVFQKVSDTEIIKSDKTRKKLLLEKRGHVCEGCGLIEWKGFTIPLDLHHVDGNTDNNVEVNLQLLCPNCHAITGTHKSRNKDGKRQQQRRQRYADGKTW